MKICKIELTTPNGKEIVDLVIGKSLIKILGDEENQYISTGEFETGVSLFVYKKGGDTEDLGVIYQEEIISIETPEEGTEKSDSNPLSKVSDSPPEVRKFAGKSLSKAFNKPTGLPPTKVADTADLWKSFTDLMSSSENPKSLNVKPKGMDSVDSVDSTESTDSTEPTAIKKPEDTIGSGNVANTQVTTYPMTMGFTKGPAVDSVTAVTSVASPTNVPSVTNVTNVNSESNKDRVFIPEGMDLASKTLLLAMIDYASIKLKDIVNNS